MKARVCSPGEIPPDGMAAFDVQGTKVCIANAQDEFYAVSDTCTHAEASLSEGYLDVAECTVECMLHGAVFSLKDGEPIEFPAEEPVKAFKVTVEGDDLFVEIPE